MVKIFNRAGKQRLGIIRLAYGWHLVAAVVLPLLLVIISYGMCHGSKPGDACGDAIGFGVGPVFFILDIIVAAIAVILSLISLDAILIVISSVFVLGLLVLIDIIVLPTNWNSEFWIFGFYALSVIVFFLASEISNKLKCWIHQYTFIVGWFRKSNRGGSDGI